MEKCFNLTFSFDKRIITFQTNCIRAVVRTLKKITAYKSIASMKKGAEEKVCLGNHFKNKEMST